MATSNVIGTMLIGVVDEAFNNMNASKNLWANSPWKEINELENDYVGKLGEKFIQNLCDLGNIPAVIDGLKTKEHGGGKGDGTILGKTVEIKCARIGTSNPSFQHELGESPWMAEYMIFVDISPSKFFISIVPNLTEENYKTKGFKWAPFFPTKSCTWRKGTGAFKLDTSLKINQTQSCVEIPYTFAWNHNTQIEEIADFIKRIIL